MLWEGTLSKRSVNAQGKNPKRSNLTNRDEALNEVRAMTRSNSLKDEAR